MFTCFCFASDKFGICDRAFFRRERFECGSKSRVVKILLLFDKSTLRIVVSGYLPLMSLYRYVDHVFDLRHSRCDSSDSITQALDRNNIISTSRAMLSNR